MTTDHLVINLKTLSKDIRKLKRMIDIYERQYKNSDFIIYDTDLKYIKKEITFFLRNLKKEISKNVADNNIDIFEREYQGLSKYIYAELIFSKDYLKISSIRLLGRKNKKTKIIPRFIIFNLNNPYDPTIIGLISNIKKIVKVDLRKLRKNPDFLRFFNKNIKPSPLIKNIKNTKKLSQEQLKNLSTKFDLKPFKNLEDFRTETKKIEDLDFKQQVYDSRINESLSLDSVTRLISDAENIIEKIENSLEHDPAGALSDIYSELLTKYNLGKILADLSLPLLKDIEPLELLKDLPVEELLKLIDGLPDDIKDKIYNIINSKINIDSFLSQIDDRITNLIEPCNFISLKNTNPNLDINEIFKNLRIKYPKFKFPQIEAIIDKEFKKIIDIDGLAKLIEPNLNIDLKQFALKIPDFELPAIDIPSLNITDLFGDISSGLDDAILNGISIGLGNISINVLESVLNFPLNDLQIDDIMNSMPDNINIPNIQIPNINNIIYPNINVNFDVKKLFKNIKIGDLSKFESIFGDKWSEFSILIEDLVKESEKFSNENSNVSSIEPNIAKVIESIGGIEQIQREQKLENKKCIDLKIKPPEFNEQNLDLDDISLNLVDPKREDIKSQLLNQIRNYRYSSIHDYLISRKPNKKIITILRKLAETDFKQKISKNTQPASKDINKSIAKMMENISSLLTPSELLNLFAGDYTHKTANIVRNVAKLNYPELATIIDPVKFYIILGKVTGLNSFKDQVDKFRKLGGKK